MNLKQQTEKLGEILEELKNRFENSTPPKTMNDRQFFEIMKKETSPTFDLLQKWEESALEFVKNKHVNVHPHQIVSTKENIELTLLHSYYIDVRERRYMELYKSITYIFDQLIVAIDRNESS